MCVFDANGVSLPPSILEDEEAIETLRFPLHVIPCDDIAEHSTVGATCWCRPQFSTEGANPDINDKIIIHNRAKDAPQ